MLNFTVGPVQINQQVLEQGAKQIPYFRTSEFSELMMKNEEYMCKFSKAPVGSKAVFITGSGTASMEAAVVNCFHQRDKVLILNGGSFGTRFVQICQLHKIAYTEIKLDYGEILTREKLEFYRNRNYTGFLVNIHETSTGIYYNPRLISEFCKENNLFLVVDAISSFLADPFEMEQWGVNVMITGSQKALALPPGISILVLDEKAQLRIKKNKSTCFYLDLKRALQDAERGQTPFTPAVSILLQLNIRLKQIAEDGLEKEQKRIKEIAEDFRKKAKELPVEFFSRFMSNSVTPIKVDKGKDAYMVFSILKDEYGIWVCPNGGELVHDIFRVGHIGALKIEDNDKLIFAMKELKKRGVL